MYSILIGDRGRRILRAGAWSFVAKSCAAANVFLSVPFVFAALGLEKFGAWAALVSLVVFAGFLDFGFSNGAMNLIASAYGRKATSEYSTVILSSWRLLIRVALIFGALGLLALPVIQWSTVVGLPDAEGKIAQAAVAITLLAITLAIPLNLANKMLLAIDEGDKVFKWQAVAQIITLIVVVALAQNDASLVALTAAAVCTPLLASVANTFSILRQPDINWDSLAPQPARQLVSRQIRREGFMFFLLQLSAALALSSDLILISMLSGSENAGKYAVVQRLFSVIPLVLSLIWVPLWPVHRQALATGDHQWAFRTLRLSMVVAILFAVVAGMSLMVGFSWIVQLWVQTPVVVSALLLGGFVIWAVLEAGGTAVATFLNAASILRFQVVTAAAFAVVCVSLKVWVVINVGIEWVPWATAISYTLIFLLPFAILRHRILSGAIRAKY